MTPLYLDCICRCNALHHSAHSDARSGTGTGLGHTGCEYLMRGDPRAGLWSRSTIETNLSDLSLALPHLRRLSTRNRAAQSMRYCMAICTSETARLSTVS